MEVVKNTNEKTLLRMKHLTEKLSLSKSTMSLSIADIAPARKPSMLR